MYRAGAIILCKPAGHASALAHESIVVPLPLSCIVMYCFTSSLHSLSPRIIKYLRKGMYVFFDPVIAHLACRITINMAQ